jgi:glycerol-3-phosphate cytidylyltransferase-like family protein
MNKMDAFSKIDFDVMFVGDDWKDTDTWKSIEKQFSELDVNIHYLKYTKGISSTEIRERLKNV